MILYKGENENNNTAINNKIIIDLKVSKNRNGQTGQCKIEFTPETSQFNNINAH